LTKKRKTVGLVAYNASHDEAKYDSLEIGHALTEDIAKELMICAQRHRQIFDEEEYCVGYVLAGDPLIKNVMRRKFFAFLYLPSPRPNQAVFLYNKTLDQFTKRLWTLPNAWTMACLSELSIVDKQFQQMKSWCDAFYKRKFWETIRKQHDINMLSEIEYLNANREKLIQAGCKEPEAGTSDPFDFSKVSVNQVVNPQDALLCQ
jgi:hypothetical protein